MNLSLLAGIVLCNIVFFASVIISLGGIGGFVDGPSILIVIGGSFSALLICTPVKGFKTAIAQVFSRLIKGKKIDYNQLIEQVVGLAQARRKGDGPFDQALKGVQDEYLKYAGSLLFWAEAEVSHEEFKDLLEGKSQSMMSKVSGDLKFFKLATKFPPAFGMMGTVLGLIALLQSMSSPDAKSKIGPAMAIALVTTLYGIAINNLMLIPLAEALDKSIDAELKGHDLVIEGMKLILENKPTKYIEEKLRSMLDDMPPEGSGGKVSSISKAA